MDNVKNVIKAYNNEEIESMNYIFGKNQENNWFSQEELSFASNINLNNKENLENAKNDWIMSYFN